MSKSSIFANVCFFSLSIFFSTAALAAGVGGGLAPQLDSDGDTVVDTEDNCPSLWNVNQYDKDGDGVGNRCDEDIDDDGILNEADNCPKQSDTTNNCVQDCSGVAGGAATLDACGTCDTDPANDCVPPGMALVPAGNFYPGATPAAPVALDAFFMDITEVTASKYKECVDAGSCEYTGSATDRRRTYNNSKEDHPINFVSYTQASAYCAYEGKSLPTDDQWEKAARGGCDFWTTEGFDFHGGFCAAQTPIYPWGDHTPSSGRAVYGQSRETGSTASVGSKPFGQSPYGIKDMAGNVLEWTGKLNAYTAQVHSRGGSWLSGSHTLRASNRYDRDPSDTNSYTGFRCAQPKLSKISRLATMGYEFDRFDLETETVRRRSFIFNDFLPTMDISWGYNSGTSPHASFFWNEQFADVAFIAKGYDDVSRADIQDENFCSHINDLSLACRDSDPYSPLVDQRSAIVRTYEGNYFKIGYIGESSATANSLGKVEFRYEQL